MSEPRQVEVGGLSPDGMWRWDGRQWVPAAEPTPGRRPTGARRTWIWWVAGGCALLLVLGVGGAIIGGAALVNRIQHTDFACLPSDFPSYPGATVTGEKTYFGTGVAPGDTRECQETLEADAEVTAVTDFYATHLDADDWRVTANNRNHGEIDFSRRSRPQTVGSILLLGKGQQTVIQIRLDS